MGAREGLDLERMRRRGRKEGFCFGSLAEMLAVSKSGQLDFDKRTYIEGKNSAVTGMGFPIVWA